MTTHISTLKFEELDFCYFKDNESIDVRTVADFSAVIINCSDKVLANHVIHKIRSNNNEAVYLKPIFIYNKIDYVDAVMNELVDGIIYNLDQLANPADTTRKIILKSKDLIEVSYVSFETYVITKALRFLYSRNKSALEPMPYRNSKIGYYFPAISSSYEANDEHKILDVLKMAEDEGLVVGEFFENIYLCNNCFDGFLNYREVCPECGSSNLNSEDLIHHFPCAYIGPMSDFTNEFNTFDMQCPKCSKVLKHIGVDYDKPSIIFSCRKCNSTFQDVIIKSKCTSCATDTDVEYLAPREIKKYQLTPKGKYAAITGIASTKSDMTRMPGTVDKATFDVMLQYEIERMKVADIDSNIAFIHLSNAKELYTMIGKDSKMTLLTELVQVTRNSIRSSDIISFDSSSTLLFSINESAIKDAEKVVEKISKLISQLIKDNFKNFEAKISYKVHPLDSAIDYKDQLRMLIKDLARE